MSRRNNLVHRRVTSVGQKVPKNAVEIAEQFLEDMKNIGEFENLANMDETPCYFDIPRPSTIDKNGVQTGKVTTTGAGRLRFTVALTAGVKKTENGSTPFRLPPLLIFKNLVKAPSGKYPAGMAVLGSKGGTVKCSMMKETYVKRIWKRRPGGLFNTGKSILLMDSAKSHLGDEVEQAFTDVKSSIKIIHGGMTPLLQFLDTHLGKPFKDIMKEKWEDWIVNGEAEFMEKGNRKRVSYQLVAEWADDTWKKVATDELIIKGFRQCGYVEYDGETASLHSRLQETIKKREVPEEVIQGVNEFLEEMMALQLDEELRDEEVELSENCTANVNENDDGESDEDNYSEENEGVKSGDDEIHVVGLQ